MKKKVLELVEGLSVREQMLMDMRFGMNGKEPMTYREMGREVGLSVERVRQLLKRAEHRIKRQLDDVPPRGDDD